MPATTTNRAPSSLEQFRAAYRREHATTMKVLRAFPAEQSELRPHERSSTARTLAWTFVIEEGGMLGLLRNEFAVRSGGFPPAPESWSQILQMFETQSEQIEALLDSTKEESLSGTVDFFSGPGQIGPVAKIDLLWFFLCDQIHHRGQLSVYTRLAGGKVPSIYGPSADEPWF
jgi:uncharacterized damage-inducible protein DinB